MVHQETVVSYGLGYRSFLLGAVFWDWVGGTLEWWATALVGLVSCTVCGRRANDELFSSRSGPPGLSMNSSGCAESSIVPNCSCSWVCHKWRAVTSLQGRMVINSGKLEAEWKRLDPNGDGIGCLVL